MTTETKNLIRSCLISTPVRCSVKELCNDFRRTIGYDIPARKLGFNNVEEYLRSIPDTVEVFGSGPSAEVKAVLTEKSAHINELVAKQKKDTIPAHKRKNLKTYQTFTGSIARPTSSNDSNIINTAIFQDEYRCRIPKRIQNNLRKLIMLFPDGVWCTKLRSEYKKMFKEDLCYEKYRYRSLIELCTDLPEIFQYIQPTSDDFVLFDRSKPIPSVNQNDVKEETESDEKLIRNLPPWVLGSSLVPSDIVHLSEEIPRISWREIKKGDTIDICVGEIYGINNFWMFLKYGKLTALLEELDSQRNRYIIPELFLETGLYCTVFYNDQYHRCVIVDVLAKLPGFVQVLFIDYGSVGRVSTSDLWYLPKKFGQVPSQAIKGSLSSVQPGKNESHQCITRFRNLVSDRQVVAEIMDINEAESAVEVYLADITNEENIFYINDILVEKGIAEYYK